MIIPIELNKFDIKKNVSIKPFNTFKTGGKVCAVVIAHNSEELVELLRIIN